MNTGWIKLHRQFQDHWLYKSKEPFTKREAWIDILLTVNHSEQKVPLGNKILICGIGESLRSFDTWADTWHWSKSKVRRFLNMLQAENMIRLTNEKITTRIRVCNWETYQVDRTTSEPQVTPNKNVKNVKKLGFKFQVRQNCF